ncbi:Methyl-accepting chemotaxis protein I (serine chemoreceptor protein) [Collimonas arenae]|uniref:Methyl-accepting chemotaxis protein I (Serine chemoreceptor protein) n=1 Tax=Collimonas arenae TaxID=279058 RepID=A0A0A1F942_9BURK|nr:PAS domain-containing methyl-accepting chemotaxis protein [Collimonas arenae]AIY41233.1 Methyl-accepting chemotaxis protein I (serine chemoreceptor protein) [Collimonas arenae]
MRDNRPITSNEYVLQDQDAIVSKTDLHGNITYVNHDFIRVSGFSEQELLGAPQNIVRHPDMPAQAFADFWRTLKAGKAWTGMVKNRCKNGDFYWVEANAAPLFDNGRVIGYTSIRVKPGREQIRAAEAAYRDIQAGGNLLDVREGRVVTRSAFDGLAAFSQISVSARLGLGFGAIFILFIINALLSWLAPAAFDWSLAASVLGALCSICFGLNLHAGTIRRLQHMRQEIDQMSSGDLAGNIVARGDDEVSKISQSLRILQLNIKWLIVQIQQSTALVNTGAREIATGNLDLSARTESQASSLEQTASAMVQLTSTVKQNADNAQEANKLVVSTSDIAEKGGAAVHQVVATMGSIKASSHKIVDIISVIDGIAFQTNILALNAAVEAARAGEQGRGFAVVATEVRSLAQRSANAAKEIKTLIGDSVEKVETGSLLVDNAGKTMNEIVDSVKRAAAIMGEISSSSREQSIGIEQVNEAITQMDGITQQNATLVEQAANAAEAMLEQSATLTQLVGTFKLLPVSARTGNQPGTRARPTINLPVTKSSSLKKPALKPVVVTAIARPQKKIVGSAAEWDTF